MTEPTGVSDTVFDLSRDNLLKIINHLPGMVYCVRNDPSWTQEFISQGSEDLHGCAAGPPVNPSFSQCENRIHPEDLPRIRQYIDVALAARKPFQVVSPRTLAELVAVLAKATIKSRYICGGTDIITGLETNGLAHDEVIAGAVFPVPSPHFRSAFEKLGAKTTVTISKINMAVGCDIDPSTRTLSDVRVAVGAVGTVARRFSGAETILEGEVYSQKIAAAFAAQVSRDVENAIQERSSMPYKRRAVQGVALDVLARCCRL